MKEKLLQIQTKLKAPKNQDNKFGGYKYRSLEDIQEALKPLLAEQKCVLTISDEIFVTQGLEQMSREEKGVKTTIESACRVYVKATATLHDCESNESISVSSFARESLTKKGMDESQITGSTSSYARKYALNALFAIDDTKDADHTNTHGKEDPKRQPKKQTQQKGEWTIKLEELEELEKKGIISKESVNSYRKPYSEKDVAECARIYNEIKGALDA